MKRNKTEEESQSATNANKMKSYLKRQDAIRNMMLSKHKQVMFTEYTYYLPERNMGIDSSSIFEAYLKSNVKEVKELSDPQYPLDVHYVWAKTIGLLGYECFVCSFFIVSLPKEGKAHKQLSWGTYLESLGIDTSGHSLIEINSYRAIYPKLNIDSEGDFLFHDFPVAKPGFDSIEVIGSSL